MNETPYPRIRLGKVLRYLPKALELAATRQAVDRMTLTEAFGYSPTTLEAAAIISSMVRFGLLYVESGSGARGKGRYQYRPTVLAFAIDKAETDGEERGELIMKVLTTPRLFSSLYDRFGADPPGNLEAILRGEYGISEKRSIKAVKIYIRSLDLAIPSSDVASPVNRRAEGFTSSHSIYSGPLTIEFGGGAKFTFAAGAAYTLKLTVAILNAEMEAVRDLLEESH